MTFNVTVTGETIEEVAREARNMADVLALSQGMRVAAPPQKAAIVPDADDEEAETVEQDAASPPGRRRGRPPGSTKAAMAAAASASANGAEKSVEDMRQEATDILKACWGKKNTPGAEKVIALQKRFGVTRFGEVPDDKVALLLQAAVSLQKELAGEAGGETGPF